MLRTVCTACVGNACPYLGCKEHSRDIADHGDGAAEEASDEGDNG